MNDKCNYCKYAHISITQENMECRNLDLCIDNSLFDPVDEWLGTSYIFEEKEKEMVNHPSHYNQGSIEVIDFIEDWELDFTTANIIKYVVRSPYKNNALEDLKKAKFYLERLINRYEKSSIQK